MDRRGFELAAVISIALAVTLASSAAGQAPAGYAGNEACVQCHREQVATFAATRMGNLFTSHPRDSIGRLGCEGCHGPAKTHAESGGDERGGLISFRKGDPTPVAQRNGLCLRCHEGGARLDWTGAPHDSRGVACTDCHKIMKNESAQNQLKHATVTETCGQCHVQKRAQMGRFAHMPVREGKLDCNSCHNPHGSPNDKLLKVASVNETCYSCHAEKRGPFLWEHAPVAESCANCHDLHGSSNEKLLVVPRARLCQRCHDESQHPTRPYSSALAAADSANSRFVYGRQCSNCHFNIHGSNHPSGARFTR
jgi:DmsE family decaheme c-type cytochrome